MKLSSINKNISNNSFYGWRNPTVKCAFITDLDGTFAYGSNKEFNEVLQILKQKDAKLIFATGRNMTEYQRLKSYLAERNKMLPEPDYLITNNGRYIFEANKKNEKYDFVFGVMDNTPVDKVDAVKYLQNTLSIPNSECVIAGNDSNDERMFCELAREGAFVICPSNATTRIKHLSRTLKNNFPDVFIANSVGARGILEGMLNIIA